MIVGNLYGVVLNGIKLNSLWECSAIAKKAQCIHEYEEAEEVEETAGKKEGKDTK